HPGAGRQLARGPVHRHRLSQGFLPEISSVPALFPAYGPGTVSSGSRQSAGAVGSGRTRAIGRLPTATADGHCNCRLLLRSLPMLRFPLSLTTTMVGYIAKKKLSGQKRFPLVLMLEPLHACNLTCTGCGRIREYETTIKERLTVDECLASVDECGAPIVSICGGEPMIYPEIGRLTREILKKRKPI